MPGNLQQLASARVLVVGDVMLDRYWFGEVERISPEAPVPVVTVQREDYRAGGAANVALNVAALGAHCDLLSVIGNDQAGQQLETILDSSAVNARMIVDRKLTTTVKLRIISRNQQLIRADFEKQPDHEVLAHGLSAFHELLPTCDVVVLSDYGKGGLRHVGQMIAAAHKLGKIVLVDPKGRDFSRYRHADLITPNRQEFMEAAGVWETDQALIGLALEMIREHQFGGLLITLSENGMRLIHANGETTTDSARSLEVYDVSGAGDTVIATYAAMTAAGYTAQLSMRVANISAGIVVGKLGAATASLSEILEQLQQEGSS